MGDILHVILPVFIVLSFGYLAVWRGLFSDEGVDGLMTFAQNFAIPCLLFRAISTLDIGQDLDMPLLFSFYAGVFGAFLAGMIGARLMFKRSWEDCVSISFCCLFSNTLLLGLPITERAFGADALLGNYAIIAFHSPIGYAIGITAMEVVHAQGTPLKKLPAKITKALFSNPMVLGISLGFVVNIGGIPVPVVLTEAIDLMLSAALPAALFALGGVLFRYRPEGDMRTILFVCSISLLLHPAIVWVLGDVQQLSDASMRSAVITAAVAPGVNAYVFANMYNAAKRIAASAVLLSTALSIITVSFWLSVLP